MIDNILLDNACKVAEEFTKLFYEAIDLKRHTLGRFYMDNATLVWDGNMQAGKENIQKFLEAFPVTAHSLGSLDGQPVAIEAVKGQQTVLVQVTGTLRLRKDDETFAFSQSFVVTAQEGKWKIFSHSCRLQRPHPNYSQT